MRIAKNALGLFKPNSVLDPNNEAVGRKWAEKRLDRGKILPEPSSSDRSQ